MDAVPHFQQVLSSRTDFARIFVCSLYISQVCAPPPVGVSQHCVLLVAVFRAIYLLIQVSVLAREFLDGVCHIQVSASEGDAAFCQLLQY